MASVLWLAARDMVSYGITHSEEGIDSHSVSLPTAIVWSLKLKYLDCGALLLEGTEDVDPALFKS